VAPCVILRLTRTPNRAKTKGNKKPNKTGGDPLPGANTPHGMAFFFFFSSQQGKYDRCLAVSLAGYRDATELKKGLLALARLLLGRVPRGRRHSPRSAEGWTLEIRTLHPFCFPRPCR
jgi:hypothetical protein